MKLFPLSIFCLSLFLMLMSCSTEPNKSEEFTVNTVLTASGPLFEGSNTFQTEISSNLSAFIKENNISKDQIVDITLVSATATLDSMDNLDLFESLNLQVFSDDYPMQNIGFANNIKKSLKKVKLKVADIQEKLKSILMEDKCYIVVDGTIREDFNDDLNLGMELVFSVNYYKK